MIRNIENETLSNIELHIKEQDIFISDLLEACKTALFAIKEEEYSVRQIILVEQLEQAINKATTEGE